MLLAKQLGAKFSIVTSSPRWKPILEENLAAVGLESSCASIRVTVQNVDDFEHFTELELEDYLYTYAQQAIMEDGAEVIVLGCCGLAGLDERLSARLGIPVLDPVASAVKILENLVDLKLHTSRAMSFGKVIPQAHKSVTEVFHPLYEGTDPTQK